MKTRKPLWTDFEPADPPYDPSGWKLFVNSRYQVGIKDTRSYPVFGQVAEITIKNRDKTPIENWRDMQKIKDDFFGKDVGMIQYFPPNKHLVDTSNQYYFFVLLDYELPFGFKERLVSEQTNRTISITNGVTVQEPFEAHQLPETIIEDERHCDELVREMDEAGWPGFDDVKPK